MKKGTLALTGFFLLFNLLTFLSGCGKTGDPRPGSFMVTETKKLSMLSLDQSECGVILTWDLAEYRSAPDMVKIYRTDFDVASGDCLTCPGTRRLIVELDKNKLSYIRELDGSYVYFDKTVKKDFVYKYAIVVCGAKGACSEPSDEVEIKFNYTMEHCR
ncbi:MAG: hypothetical protein JW902_15765 [Syntrophaceae bacterium]|nr:hypothetical protein [Syntrophaceae bacterium]